MLYLHYCRHLDYPEKYEYSLANIHFRSSQGYGFRHHFNLGDTINWLRAIFPALQSGQHIGEKPPLPRHDPRFFCNRDVHGRIVFSNKLISQVTEQPDHSLARTIFVGDVIDRGPKSSGVLERIYALQRSPPEHVISLMGNHERMLLDFLHNPVLYGTLWFAAGDGETLASFSLSP